MFRLDHIEDVLKGEWFEIEPIAGVVVGRYGFRVAVHHHRGQALFLKGEGGMAAAVIKFDSLADPVWTTAQDHHLGSAFRLHLRLRRQYF